MNTILSSVIIGGVYAWEKTASPFCFSVRGGGCTVHGCRGDPGLPQRAMVPIQGWTSRFKAFTYLPLCVISLFPSALLCKLWNKAEFLQITVMGITCRMYCVLAHAKQCAQWLLEIFKAAVISVFILTMGHVTNVKGVTRSDNYYATLQFPSALWSVLASVFWFLRLTTTKDNQIFPSGVCAASVCESKTAQIKWVNIGLTLVGRPETRLKMNANA